MLSSRPEPHSCGPFFGGEPMTAHFPNSPQPVPNTPSAIRHGLHDASRASLSGFSSPHVALAASACGGGSDSVPAGAIAVVDGTEISRGRPRRAHRAGEEGLRGAEAGVPEGRHARVPEHPDPVRRVPRRARGVQAGGRGARRRGHGRRTSTRPSRSSIKTRFDGKRAEYEKALRRRASRPSSTARRRSSVSALVQEDLRRGHEGREGDRAGDPRVLHAEPVAVRRRPSRATCGTSSSPRSPTATRSTSPRARPRRTTSTRSSRAARTSRRSRRRAPPTRAARTRAAS